ncbi:MAG: PEP-CTERM sorting domain-containing protein [Acidobacteria bacterium]|nr:PEP-CTERM sorting domain-containing protein [Acidobacteriota bacterium]
MNQLLQFKQLFTLTPIALVNLHILETNQNFQFPAGTQINIPFPTGYNYLTIIPTFSMNAKLTNVTSFALQQNLCALAGTFSAWSLQLGPIFSKCGNLGTLKLNVFNQTFPLAGFGSSQGTTSYVTPNYGVVPEPATLMLMGTGLVALGYRLRRGACRRHSRRAG